MPKREDDFWASQQEGLRYCVKHKHYYREDVGCQLCQLEQWGATRKGKEDSRLERCPDCREFSLFWNSNTQFYECINLKCKHNFNKNELEARKLQEQTEETDEIGEEEHRPALQQCPICKKKSLFWNENTQLYECLNQKCKRRFTNTDLELIKKSPQKNLFTKPVGKPKQTRSDSLFDTEHVGYYEGEYKTKSIRQDKPKTSPFSVLYLTFWLTFGVALR